MKFLKNVMVYFLCANFFLLSGVGAKESAKVLGSDLDQKLRELKEQTQSSTSLRQKLLRNLDKEEGKKILEAYGVNQEEFKERMMAMSEKDLREMLENKRQVGGEVVVIGLSTLLLIIILILIID